MVVFGPLYHFTGMLHRREIEISPQDFTITKSRASVVDFLPGITPTYAQIFIRNPDHNWNWMAYLEPLKPSCWIAILALLLVVPMIVTWISLWGKHITK